MSDIQKLIDIVCLPAWRDLDLYNKREMKNQAASDLARITAENVELKRLLIEQVGEHGWTNGGDYPDFCRTCESTAKQGHKADCRLAAALKQSS